MKKKIIITEKDKVLKKFYSNSFSFAKNRKFVLDNMKVIKDDLQLRQESLSEVVGNELFKMKKEPYNVDRIDVKRKMKKELGADKYNEIKDEMKEWVVYVEEETIKEEISRLLIIKGKNSTELKQLRKATSIWGQIKNLFVSKEKRNEIQIIRKGYDERIRFIKKEQPKINKQVKETVKKLKKLKKQRK